MATVDLLGSHKEPKYHCVQGHTEANQGPKMQLRDQDKQTLKAEQDQESWSPSHCHPGKRGLKKGELPLPPVLLQDPSNYQRISPIPLGYQRKAACDHLKSYTLVYLDSCLILLSTKTSPAKAMVLKLGCTSDLFQKL